MNLRNEQEMMHERAQALLEANRVPEALALYRQLCEADSTDAEAHWMIGAIKSELGLFDEAARNVSEAISINPDYPEAYLTLGSIKMRQHDIEGALPNFQRAVSLDPEFAEAWMMLGAAAGQQGDYAQAATCSRRAVSLEPRLAEAHLNLGNALKAQENLQDAVESYRLALGLQPQIVDAWVMLAEVLLRLGQVDRAHEVCQQALKLAPNSTECLLIAGETLEAGQNLVEAQQCYQTAVESQPGLAQAWFRLGVVNGRLGNYRVAEANNRRAIELQPSHVEAYLNLGVALSAQDRMQESLAVYRQLLEYRDNIPQAWLGAGIASGAIGDQDAEEAYYRRALALMPYSVETQLKLGECLERQGRNEEALQVYQAIVEHDSQQADGWWHLGRVSMVLGRLRDAEICSGSAIRLDKDCIGAHLELGRVFMEQGRFSEAASSFQKAHASDTGRIEPWLGIAMVFQRQSRYQEAEECLQNALRSEPDNGMAIHQLAHLLASQGQFDAALDWFTRALELNSDDLEAAVGIAKVHELAGNHVASLECLRPFVDAGLLDIRITRVFARLSRHFNHYREALAQLEGLLSAENTGFFDQVELNFIAGTLHDEVDEYDQAFRYFQTGNALMAGVSRFDPVEHSEYIDRVVEATSAEALGRIPEAGNTSELPVFIVGMPRSGTSLVEQIIASHPSVAGAGELPDIQRYTSLLHKTAGSEQTYPGCLGGLSTALVDSLAEQHLEKLRRLGGVAKRVTDKLPQNFIHLGFIQKLFPRARIIHMMRDPMDTCLSCHIRNFNAGSLDYTLDLATLGHYYRDYLRIMAHWKSVLELPILEVRYEDLVENTEVVIGTIIEFCGLDWDEKCLRFNETERYINTVSYDQVRQPIYSRSIGRWKCYEKYLKPLKMALEKS